MVDFKLSRSHEGPWSLVGDWSGVLISDVHSGYDEVCEQSGIMRAGCWAHARRKLKDALDGGARKAAWPLLW